MHRITDCTILSYTQANLGYFGPQYEYIYSLTHTETFHVWNAMEVRVFMLFPLHVLIL